jgi:hypothetical protein
VQLTIAFPQPPVCPPLRSHVAAVAVVVAAAAVDGTAGITAGPAVVSSVRLEAVARPDDSGEETSTVPEQVARPILSLIHSSPYLTLQKPHARTPSRLATGEAPKNKFGSCADVVRVRALSKSP